MATTVIEIPKLPENVTLTCDVYPRGSDTADQTGISLTEETNREGVYQGNLTAASSGNITVIVKLSGAKIADATGTVADDTSTYIIEDAVGFSLATWTTAITESYAASGAAGTPAQILYMIQQAIMEFSIASTTKTIKKLDGSTTAATGTLNDAASPTAITRAT